MSEYIDTSADHDPEDAARIPGKRLYSAAYRVLFSCFFVTFLLVAHQHFFTGLERSVLKQYLLFGILPVVLVAGAAGLVGWWRMRQAGAFAIPVEAPEEEPEPEPKRRRSRQEPDGGLEPLPWQRRDRH